jgi:hypothetical protein
MICGAEACNLGAMIHGAELKVHFLKSFQKGSTCENLSQKGLKSKKDGVPAFAHWGPYWGAANQRGHAVKSNRARPQRNKLHADTIDHPRRLPWPRELHWLPPPRAPWPPLVLAGPTADSPERIEPFFLFSLGQCCSRPRWRTGAGRRKRHATREVRPPANSAQRRQPDEHQLRASGGRPTSNSTHERTG